MKNTAEALKWIVGILEKHSIAFRISGGFAAKAYGSSRELADIDIGMKENHFPEIIEEIKEYIISGPELYKDEEWDLFAATLSYQGQEIDLYPISELKFFNKKENQWEDLKHTFSDIVFKEMYGVRVPLISKLNLIEYKNKLKREVDITDVKEMAK
jgi:hypothetical protein